MIALSLQYSTYVATIQIKSLLSNPSRSPTPPMANMDNPTAPIAPPPVPPANLISFLRLVGRLKTTKRTGWKNHSIPLPESIADHMYRMSLLGLTFHNHPNHTHLIKLSIVHDLAESLVGDITPFDDVTPAEKHARESAAMAHIRDVELCGSSVGHELFSLWREYEDANTDEARLVKEFDKFEMILQADEYERMHHVTLNSFFDSTAHSFHSPYMQTLNEELRRSRDDRLTTQNHPSKPNQ